MQSGITGNINMSRIVSNLRANTISLNAGDDSTYLEMPHGRAGGPDEVIVSTDTAGGTGWRRRDVALVNIVDNEDITIVDNALPSIITASYVPDMLVGFTMSIGGILSYTGVGGLFNVNIIAALSQLGDLAPSRALLGLQVNGVVVAVMVAVVCRGKKAPLVVSLPVLRHLSQGDQLAVTVANIESNGRIVAERMCMTVTPI